LCLGGVKNSWELADLPAVDSVILRSSTRRQLAFCPLRTWISRQPQQKRSAEVEEMNKHTKKFRFAFFPLLNAQISASIFCLCLEHPPPPHWLWR
jgi:hypothetical protein